MIMTNHLVFGDREESSERRYRIFKKPVSLGARHAEVDPSEMLNADSIAFAPKKFKRALRSVPGVEVRRVHFHEGTVTWTVALSPEDSAAHDLIVRALHQTFFAGEVLDVQEGNVDDFFSRLIEEAMRAARRDPDRPIVIYYEDWVDG